MAEFCQIWISNYELIVKPVYEALKVHDLKPLTWIKECQTAFETIKTKLISAPALRLPDIKKPFKLYVHERQAIILGVLIQTLGNIPWLVVYFSKQLDIPLPLSCSCYLLHTSGSQEIHPGVTHHHMCPSPCPFLTGAKRGLLADF